MIQGEPLEMNTASEDESASMPAEMVDTWDTDSNVIREPEKSNDFLSRTFETAKQTPDDASDETADDVGTMLDEAEEDVRDALWMSAEAADDAESSTGTDNRDNEKQLNDSVLTLPERQETTVQETADRNTQDAMEDGMAHDPEDLREETDALLDTVIASQDEDKGAESAIDLNLPEPSPKATPEASSSLLSLQAINLLNDKIATTETRYDGALNKIGHALGVIAERIDGLESRITDQAITKVAMAADPKPVEDDSVAPYIARAEKELAAKKGSGPVDIFDRIARAAETEYESQRGGGARIIADAGDGRRVGTKRWQPSKTVKKRMEQLEKARAVTPESADTAGNVAAAALAGDTTAPADAGATATNPSFVQDTPATGDMDQTVAPQTFIDEETDFDDESGLSVVPGARGRRKNRARKSRLDEDFENVFAEDDGEPSIQNLRRKMRQKPSEGSDQVTTAEEPAGKAGKSGFLGGILGKKSAKKTAVADDVLEEVQVDIPDEDDELELMAAFDESVEIKPKKNATAVKVKDELDDVPGRKGLLNGPVLYAVITAIAALAFFIWQKFVA